MLKKLCRKINKSIFNVLNSKITYQILLLIMLIQFILVSFIFLQNKKNKYLLEQTNFRVATIENQQKQLNEKINSLNSNVMRMSSQIYRLKASGDEN